MFTHTHQNAEEFLTRVQPALLTEEVKNSLILGIAHHLQTLPIDRQTPYLATTEDEEE